VNYCNKAYFIDVLCSKGSRNCIVHIDHLLKSETKLKSENRLMNCFMPQLYGDTSFIHQLHNRQK